ncbi:soluble lamin-associated protein of 75 kDa isoform X3 [Sorex fumeus]|nr:soluble lamin-associated protein of 75 kDa isoform X3 [Sorex fumeus]
MFVRKKYRGIEFGLHILEDFVDSFTEDALGLRYPLSSLMYTACKQYFEKYPGDHELLWEVEGVGHWYQRKPISRALQRETLKIKAVSQNEAKRSISGNYGLACVPEYEAGTEDNQSSDMQLTIGSLKDAFASTPEGHEKTPVSTRTRSSHLKRPKIGKRFLDSEFNSQGEGEKTSQTSPTANKLEFTTRISESSEEIIEEEFQESMVEFEDGSVNKEALQTPETQAHLEKQADEKESELEPLNGEVVDDTLKTSLVTEEEDSASEVLEELKLQSLNSNEDSANLVPSVIESAKPPEAIAQDKVSPTTGSETLLDENLSEEKGHNEEKTPLVSRKKVQSGGSDSVASVPNEERADGGLPSSVTAEFPEEPVSENVALKTSSSLEDQGEEAVPEPQETPAALPQGSLIEVELEDVPFSQSAGQKSQSEEQSEASSEQLDQFAQSAEKVVDSSSEEIEVEIPIVDRRNLRRKAKGHKGPAKKKAKLI